MARFQTVLRDPKLNGSLNEFSAIVGDANPLLDSIRDVIKGFAATLKS